MPKDVLITPASSKIEFKDVSSNIDGLIQLDASDNLSITSPNGVLNLGSTGHVYIGDGTNVTDLIFDQSGTIKAATGKTLTIGASGSNVTFTGTVSSLSNITIGPSGQYGRINNTDPYHAVILRGSTDAAGTITAGNTMEFAEFGGIWRFKAINGTTMTTALDMSTTAATFNGTVSGTRLISTVATGTAPLTVSSTTVVTNLNADLFDGINSDKFVYGSTQAGSVTASVTQTFSEAAQWKSGFWEVSGASWTPNTNWFWGLTMAHTSAGPAYLYGAQLAAGIGTTDGLYFRTTNGGPTPSATAWNKVAFLASPALTGTPTAPTATAGTNTTQIATTAFVTTAVSGIVGGASYQTTAPSTPTVGQIWVDSDATLLPVSTRWSITASGGETTVSGLGAGSIPLIYTPGYEQVYLNGVLLVRNDDYTANTGTSVVFTEALTAGDSVQIIMIEVTEISNTYTQAQIDEKIGDAGFNPFLLVGM